MKTFLLTEPDGEKREYKFKFSLKSMMAYEQLSSVMDKETQTKTMMGLLALYSCFYASNDEAPDVSAFIEQMSDDVELYAAVMSEYSEQSSEFMAVMNGHGGDDKKKR